MTIRDFVYMKSKREVKTFLQTVRAADELNKLAIAGYCNEVLGFQVYIEEKNSDLPAITLNDFKEWLCEKTFHHRDIVTFQNSGLGIVKEMGYKEVVLFFLIDENGTLYDRTVAVNKAACRLATDEEIISLQRILNKKKIGWNNRRNVLFKQEYVPQNNHYVRLSILGRKIGLGIFKEFDAHGQITMYCVKMNDEPPRYSLDEKIGAAENFQITRISTYERNILSAELKRNGIQWNGHRKQIEHIRVRSKKGNLYYYLNDLFQIISKPDAYQSRDTKRWQAGNYFTQPEEIEAVRKKLVSRKK